MLQALQKVSETLRHTGEATRCQITDANTQLRSLNQHLDKMSEHVRPLRDTLTALESYRKQIEDDLERFEPGLVAFGQSAGQLKQEKLARDLLYALHQPWTKLTITSVWYPGCIAPEIHVTKYTRHFDSGGATIDNWLNSKPKSETTTLDPLKLELFLSNLRQDILKTYKIAQASESFDERPAVTPAILRTKADLLTIERSKAVTFIGGEPSCSLDIQIETKDRYWRFTESMPSSEPLSLQHWARVKLGLDNVLNPASKN